MPIDLNTGMWSTPPLSDNPGPGGAGSAIGGLLGVMNAFRGKTLSDQADAARKQAELDAIQKNASTSGSDLYQTPEGQSIAGAYDISPETTSGIFESNPNRQLRMALGELTKKYPDQQIPSWELENAYVTHGMAPPTGLYGYMGRQQTAETAKLRITHQDVQKMAGDMVTAQKASQSAEDDEPTQRRKAEAAAGPLYAILPAEQRALVDAEFQKQRDAAQGQGASGLPAARVAELGARTDTEIARTNYLDTMASVASEKVAQANNLTDLRADILRLRGQILQQQVNGQLSPATRARMLTQVMALETKKANRLNIAGFELTPEAKAAGPALDKEYQGAIDEIKELLKGGPPKAGTAPGKGAYSSPEQVRDDSSLSPEQKISILKSQFGFGD